MTKKAEIWSARVAEWRASGQTSLEFCEGKGFTPSGMRHWAHRLKQQELAASGEPSVRMARVVRGRRSARGTAVAASDAAITIEIGTTRVSVRTGFEGATLAAVLDVLSARGDAR